MAGFLWNFGGCADESRYSTHGRLLALLVKRRGLGSGIYGSLSLSLILSFPTILLWTDHP